MLHSFFTEEEQNIGKEFLESGYKIFPVENMDSLEYMRDVIVSSACRQLNMEKPSDYERFLNNVHNYVSPEKINDFRMKIIQDMSEDKDFRRNYFFTGKRSLEQIVGNEMVMQRRVNLSIQMPNDHSSVLPVHADVWSGDSAFEVVMWIPLVNCYKTKAMFYHNAKKDSELQKSMSKLKGKSAEDLFQEIANDVEFIKVDYGQLIIFTQNIMHGNRLNIEPETRWSMNCRFKGVFSPYDDKKLGEFFEPITIRPATRAGMTYRLPEGFSE